MGTNQNINAGYSMGVEGSTPYPYSGHSSGVNVVMCDGSARFISSTIDGTVWSKLITPAGSRLPPIFKQFPLSQDAIGN